MATIAPSSAPSDGSVSPASLGPCAPVFLMINSLETGGSERQFAALAANLNQHLFSLQLGCIMEKGAFLEGLGPAAKFGLGGSLYSAKSFHSRFRLARHLRRHRIAVAQAFDFYTNLVLLPVARMARVPVVIGSQRQIGDLLTPTQSRAQRMAFHFCDMVVSNSHAAADRLVQEGLPQTKVTVIPNGLPPAAFAETAPLLPRRAPQVRVGMIARMNHRAKNHSLFIRAAARVVAQMPEVEFVLVGDGPFRAEFQQQAAALAPNHIRFLGDRRDIPAVLASLDLTVLPSSSESLSNSIIESMAAGVPVIATRVGGNCELLGNDRGVLVGAGDEQELAAAIASLIRDHALRVHLGEKTRLYAQANFTVAHMHRHYEELYLQLLARKSWRPKARSMTSRASPNSML